MSAFNAEAFIEEAVTSILSQTYENVEVLIADDGSMDNTRRVLDRLTDRRIRRCDNRENLGYLRTRNRLFRLAAGEFVTLQDADDISLPNRIENQVGVFLADPALAICGTFYETMTAEGQIVRRHHKPTDWMTIRERLREANQFCGSTVMFRRSLLEEAGYYRPYFDRIGHEDYDLTWRIAERHKAINIAEVQYRYRVLPNSFSRAISDRRKLYGNQIVQFLAAERAATGQDSLMRGDLEALERVVAELDRPYREDPSLQHRHLAAIHMYDREYVAAIRRSLAAVCARPVLLRNYRILFHCLRRAVWRSLKSSNAT